MTPESTSTVLIAGAGQAGCQVATSLRQDGFTGRIVLIGAEPHLPYQRPPLSKGHLTGKAARDTLWLRPEAWFAENHVELRLGTRVHAIDPEARMVDLGSERLGYDTLVLALGARHRELPVSGTDLDGVVSLRSLDEADDIRARLEAAHDLVVIGGGFIGMEVASTAAALGKNATVVEVAPQLMGRVLSGETADFLLEAHRRRGLTIALAASVHAILGDARVSGVRVADAVGERVLPADLVLVGIGAVPQVELAAAAGLEIDNGIAVDEHLRTSDPHIYAIGDCVSCPNPFAGGQRIRLESVQNAVAQGRDVAATITGHGAPHSAVPWFWSDQADLKLQIAGLVAGHEEVVITGDRAAEKFSAYCFAAGRLVGVESVNSPADHMAARRLVAAPRSLSADEVRDPAFSPKAAVAALKG